MGCCSSTDEAKGTTGRRGSNEFNDLHDDGPKAREGNKTGQASPTARGKKYAATSNAAAPGVDGDIDMDAQVASVLAAQPKPGKVPAAAAASPAHSPSPSSSDASSDDEGGAAAPPPPPPTMPVIMQRKDPNSLAQSEAELEEARRKREEAKKEAGVETKAMEIFFDDDDAVEPDVDPDAEQGAVEDFSAALSIPSPTKNLGLEGRDPDAVPGPWWFTDRGVLPPRSVVWYQNRDSIFIEITPANEDAGYGITDGNKLCYNCSIAPADSAAAPAAIESFSPTDIILYTTTVSGNTITKQHCRDMERILYLHKLHAHTMDVGEHGFMRKVIIQQCGGKDLGLPLLFVGERLIGTSEDVQLLVDREDFLKTLGDEVVAKARAGFTGVPTNDEVYRVELSLLGKVQGPHWTVVPSNRPNVQPGEKMMTLRAMKLGDPKYWPQLIKGTMAEIKELSWLSRDMTREVDSDDDDDVA